MLYVCRGLQRFGEDVGDVSFGRDSPYSASSLYVVLSDGVVAYVNGARDISHVGLSGEIFCSLVVTVEIVRRVFRVAHEVKDGTNELACRVSSG